MEKKTELDILTSTVISLFVYHNVSDLITMVSGEVPMDTYSAFQHLEKQMTSVMKIIFYVKNFTASAFLSSTGKTGKLTSD